MYMNCNQEYYNRNAMDEYELDDIDDCNLDDKDYNLNNNVENQIFQIFMEHKINNLNIYNNKEYNIIYDYF